MPDARCQMPGNSLELGAWNLELFRPKLFRSAGVYREWVVTECSAVNTLGCWCILLRFLKSVGGLERSPNGGDLMKKNTKEKSQKELSRRDSRKVLWKLSQEDKRFLRSLNVSPD